MKSKLVGLLFALPFLGVGIFATFLLVMDLHDAWRMRDWVTVPATLESAGYSTSAGEDAGTYKAYARYRYKVDGVRYRNDRVSISGGIGAGVLSATLRSSGRVDTQHAAATSQPWLLRPAWQHNGIRSSSRSTMWMAWGFATLWSLISAPLPFLVFEEVQQKGNTLAWLGLLFPLVGAGLIIAALQRTREWRRFGRAPLILDPFPGADLDRDYEIPVYATKAGSAALPGHSIDIARAGQRERDLAAVQALFESKFTTSGRALFYPMGRHPAFGIDRKSVV